MTHSTASTPHSEEKHAEKSKPAEEHTASQQSGPASVQPVESDDAQLAGHKQSQQHEALRQNVQGKQAQQHPEYVAGQHATGSFTGTADQKDKK